VNLDDPATTLALLKLNAVVGVKGWLNRDGSLKTIGIECALCRSTVDELALAPGVLRFRARARPARRGDRARRAHSRADARADDDDP
jgi:hypothetical protein